MLTMETRQEERNKELDILLRAANEYLTDALFGSPALARKQAILGLIYTVERMKEEVER